MPKKEIAVDSEFVPITDEPTIPVCVTLAYPGLEEKFFIHPSAPIHVIKKAEEVGDKIFKSPFALIDYFGWDWEEIGNKKLKNYLTLETHIFLSFKDLEFLCATKEFYKKNILPHLSRTRRISSGHVVEANGNHFYTESIGLPLCVKIEDERGILRWHKLSIRVVDIAAMQGSESLQTYATNVGIVMESKNTYNGEEKKRMDLRYVENHIKCKEYALGDTPLIEIKNLTIKFYNTVASLVNVSERENSKFYGMSTGKIVASLLNDWLCQELNIDSEELYKINQLAGSEGITNLSKLLKNRNLIYAAMVDGGRASKERRLNPYYKRNTCYLFREGHLLNILKGVLIDIDISGCYGNGLLNQHYAVGTPTIDDNEYTLEVWQKKYSNQMIPGLWCARISYENAPFKQDLLISKTKEAYTSWGWVIRGEDSEGFSILDDGHKVYDAGMRLTTNSIHQASINHDLLQTLKVVSSKQEWGWLLKNAKVTSTLIYQKKHEVKKITPFMKEGVKISSDKDVLLKGTKDWFRVDLSKFIGVLLKERKKHPKKTPMNTFLKLIINTIYGCIASEYFSVKDACVSNVVIGNNITSRARCLAWLMAKGFHSAMSVTDGGVFNINKVLKFRKKSLNLLESLYDDCVLTPHDETRFCEQIPLLGYEIKYDKYLLKTLLRDCDKKALCNLIKSTIVENKVDVKNISKTVNNIVKSFALSVIDKVAWQHLKNTFPGIDILERNQFSFETKDIYSKLTLHSKVDYLLEKPNGERTIAWRGMPRVWSEAKSKKIDNPICLELFEAIETGKPIKRKVISSKMLSLAEYEIKVNCDPNYPLLPHDQISKEQVFFSHTPRGNRYPDLKAWEEMEKEFENLKNNGTALDIAKIE